MVKSSEITLGNIFVDDRGVLRFVNDFDFLTSAIKRFYQVSNHKKGFIRAWHGHMKEKKYVYVVLGSIKICITSLKITTKGANEEIKLGSNVQTYILSDKNPKILEISAGFANGFKTLEDNTEIIFFSTSTVEESKNDDYRFKWDILGEEIWKIENR